MSGDRGPEVVADAAVFIAKQYPNLHLFLVGHQGLLQDLLINRLDHKQLNEQIHIVHADEVVSMDDPPLLALRNKRNSSMRVAINMVKNGDVDACVSAGNTGALMATARFVLKMIPGIDRPAICCALPSAQGHTYMMDLGANVDCSSEHLYQFALMGSVLVNAIDNIDKPRVGLLNIGEEEIKGNDVVKQASQLLSAGKMNYIGYVEGNDIFGEKVDVIVTDGFVGNVSLKTIEGVAKLIADFLAQEFKRNWFTKLIALLALPALNRFKRRVDPRRYNGASLLGLQGIVVKSHGSADKVAFSNAIKIAMLEVQHNIIGVIDRSINANGETLN